MEKIFLWTLKIGLIGVFLVTPLLYWSSTMYPYLTLKIVVFQSLIEILITFWLSLIVFYKEYRPKLTPLLITFIVFLGILFISASMGVDWHRSFWSNQPRLTGLFLFIHLFLLFLILSSVKIFWRQFFWFSLTAGTIASVTGFIEKFLLNNLFRSADSGRASSLFGNPTFLAGYLLLNVFVGLYLYATETNKWLKIFAGISAFITAFGILLTQTMGDLGALAIGVFLLLIYYIFRLPKTPEFNFKRKLLVSGIIFSLIFSGIFFLTKKSTFWRYVPGLSRVAQVSLIGNLQNRFWAWEAGWQGFKERPVLGWGWENFNIIFNKFYNPQLLVSGRGETYWDKPHNIFLEYLYTTGLLGFIGFLGLLGAIFYESWRVWKKFPEIIFFIVGLIAYLIQGLVVFDTFGVYLMLILYWGFVDMKYIQNYKSQIPNNK